MKSPYLGLLETLLDSHPDKAALIFIQICSLPCDCTVGLSLNRMFEGYYLTVAQNFSRLQNIDNRQKLIDVISELEGLQQL